ncbi:hypothetical protein, partial [Mesotoga sp. UBA5847]|uniref:hypothetical protein n=1 Tax=Mesotoga sp. UBA5847 TaxID=1946859 RepID=UPI0025D3E357
RTMFYSVQRIFTNQSPSVASLCFAKANLAFGEAISDFVGQKNRCSLSKRRRTQEEQNQLAVRGSPFS